LFFWVSWNVFFSKIMRDRLKLLCHKKSIIFWLLAWTSFVLCKSFYFTQLKILLNNIVRNSLWHFVPIECDFFDFF
jgi:hypothetical protein